MKKYTTFNILLICLVLQLPLVAATDIIEIISDHDTIQLKETYRDDPFTIPIENNGIFFYTTEVFDLSTQLPLYLLDQNNKKIHEYTYDNNWLLMQEKAYLTDYGPDGEPIPYSTTDYTYTPQGNPATEHTVLYEYPENEEITLVYEHGTYDFDPTFNFLKISSQLEDQSLVDPWFIAYVYKQLTDFPLNHYVRIETDYVSFRDVYPQRGVKEQRFYESYNNEPEQYLGKLVNAYTYRGNLRTMRWYDGANTLVSGRRYVYTQCPDYNIIRGMFVEGVWYDYIYLYADICRADNILMDITNGQDSLYTIIYTEFDHQSY